MNLKEASMFRILLSMVLMLLVSLPNGICICHAMEADHADVDTEETPADGDHDCPCCKMKPALACSADLVTIERGGECVPTFESISLIQIHALTVQGSRESSAFPASIPLPLLHCALRI